MSQATVQDNNAQQLVKKPLVPPDERFWKRYSPHHEFPLSVAGSVLLHALCFFVLLLIVGGLLARWLNLNSPPPEIGAIALAGGGGGNPLGIEKGVREGVVPTGKEAVQANPQQMPPSMPIEKPEPLKIQDPQARPPELDLKPSEASERRLEESTTILNQLKEISSRAGEIQKGLLVDKGQGGPGTGGGRGGGDGPGVGESTGPGSGREQTVRQKRQARWFMEFPPSRSSSLLQNGQFLLQQLHGMGATLVIRQPNGKYLVIRDLLGGGERGGQVNELNGMYWIWDKPQDVMALTAALRLKQPPADKVIAAFFPEELEAELLAKERAASGGLAEDEIELTVFEVVPRGNRYEPVVRQVKPRRGR